MFLLAAYVAAMLSGTAKAVAPWPHVRSEDARVARAVVRGGRDSPTFQRLLDDLDRPDVIVVIDTRECACSRAVSCVSFVTSSGSVRYLRANVSLRQIDDRLVQQIGHELLHAVEIAADPDIQTEAALARAYARPGRGCGQGRGCLEMEEARQVEMVIAREISHARKRR